MKHDDRLASARGVVNGIILGIAFWYVIAILAVAAYRYFH